MLVKYRRFPLKAFHPTVSRGPLSWTSMKYVERRIDPSLSLKNVLEPFYLLYESYVYTVSYKDSTALQSSSHQGSLRTHHCQRQIQCPTHGRGRSACRLLRRGLSFNALVVTVYFVIYMLIILVSTKDWL